MNMYIIYYVRNQTQIGTSMSNNYNVKKHGGQINFNRVRIKLLYRKSTAGCVRLA